MARQQVRAWRVLSRNVFGCRGCPPMSNLQKNHVKIDVFKEPKYHFDPNQVQSTSFRPHKTPNKQKNSAFVTFFLGRNASAASTFCDVVSERLILYFLGFIFPSGAAALYNLGASLGFLHTTCSSIKLLQRRRRLNLLKNSVHARKCRF